MFSLWAAVTTFLEPLLSASSEKLYLNQSSLNPTKSPLWTYYYILFPPGIRTQFPTNPFWAVRIKQVQGNSPALDSCSDLLSWVKFLSPQVSWCWFSWHPATQVSFYEDFFKFFQFCLLGLPSAPPQPGPVRDRRQPSSAGRCPDHNSTTFGSSDSPLQISALGEKLSSLELLKVKVAYWSKSEDETVLRVHIELWGCRGGVDYSKGYQVRVATEGVGTLLAHWEAAALLGQIFSNNFEEKLKPAESQWTDQWGRWAAHCWNILTLHQMRTHHYKHHHQHNHYHHHFHYH